MSHLQILLNQTKCNKSGQWGQSDRCEYICIDSNWLKLNPESFFLHHKELIIETTATGKHFQQSGFLSASSKTALKSRLK